MSKQEKLSAFDLFVMFMFVFVGFLIGAIPSYIYHDSDKRQNGVYLPCKGEPGRQIRVMKGKWEYRKITPRGWETVEEITQQKVSKVCTVEF